MTLVKCFDDNCRFNGIHRGEDYVCTAREVLINAFSECMTFVDKDEFVVAKEENKEND